MHREIDKSNRLASIVNVTLFFIYIDELIALFEHVT